MKYKQLTKDQRCQIWALKSTGTHTQKKIAVLVGTSPGTISRELKRNTGGRGYRHAQAHEKSIERRSHASTGPKRMTPEVMRLVKRYLRERWSPEQIAGVLAANAISISHESIYSYIWKDKRAGGELYTYLRRRGKKYNYRGAKTAGRGCIPDRVGIEERPAIVERKCRLGDWEGDTIIGAKHRGVILSLVDRKSKFTLLEKMEGKYADQVPQCVEVAFNRLPRIISHQTMTFDNGKEFSAHKEIAIKAGIRQCFFATPYRSGDRGLNEHTNGLVRQYFPKGTNFALCTPEEIQQVEDQLNNRPRKVLGYRTPKEVFLNKRRPQKIALGT